MDRDTEGAPDCSRVVLGDVQGLVALYYGSLTDVVEPQELLLVGEGRALGILLLLFLRLGFLDHLGDVRNQQDTLGGVRQVE